MGIQITIYYCHEYNGIRYTALSMALRAAIPLLAVISSVTKRLNYLKHQQLSFKATIREDNQGALILANLEPGRRTVRSTFYALWLHWFRSWIIPNNINIQFILEHSIKRLTSLLKHLALEYSKRIESSRWVGNPRAKENQGIQSIRD